MTDPRIAALAEALPEWMSEHPQGCTEAELRLTIAENIFAALPDDWCGHGGKTWREARSEVARLRRIEEAAQEAEERLDTLWTAAAPPQDDPERWAQATYFTLQCLRVALETP
jgi:hypothetical protein